MCITGTSIERLIQGTGLTTRQITENKLSCGNKHEITENALRIDASFNMQPLPHFNSGIHDIYFVVNIQTLNLTH